MELNFNSKRQQTDFELLYTNIVFDIGCVKKNGFNAILIDLNSYNINKDDVKSYIKSLNNKNIMYNYNRNMISIS